MSTATLEGPPSSAPADPSGATTGSAGAAGPAPRNLVTGGLVLAIATFVASAGNYGLNLVLGRWLTPAQFADATLIITLFLVVTGLALCVQLVTTRHVAQAGDPDHQVRVRSLVARRAWQTGTVLGLLTAVSAPALADLFQLSDPLHLVLFGLGLPFYLAQAADRGLLQGRQQLSVLARTYVVEMAVRTVVTLAIVPVGAGGLAASVGLTTSLVATWWFGRRRAVGTVGWIAIPTGDDQEAVMRSLRASVSPIAALLAAQIVIANGDLLVAKQSLSPTTAGSYAALALVGRAVYFASMAVVNAVFPEVARRDGADEHSGSLLAAAVGAVAAISVLGTVAIALAGTTVLQMALGSAYALDAHLLTLYSVATACFAVANVIASHHVAAGDRRFGWLLLAGSGVQTMLLIAAPATLAGLVGAQVLAMAWLLVATIVAHGLVSRTAPVGNRPRGRS